MATITTQEAENLPSSVVAVTVAVPPLIAVHSPSKMETTELSLEVQITLELDTSSGTTFAMSFSFIPFFSVNVVLFKVTPLGDTVDSPQEDTINDKIPKSAINKCFCFIKFTLYLDYN